VLVLLTLLFLPSDTTQNALLLFRFVNVLGKWTSWRYWLRVRSLNR